jgi:hypothetical protein
MYLHIGNGKNVRKKNIIGIFDLDTATVSKITKRFINKKEKKGLVEYSDYDLPRSFILVDNNEDSKIILSRISTQGLIYRSDLNIVSDNENN